MKALFSEKYYRQFWDRFLEKVPGDDYINLEDELKFEMHFYPDTLPAEALQALEKIKAKEIANRCKELCLKEMETVKALEAGKASLGYTTQSQEIHARAEFRKRFEFNCLQLRDFKEKYRI